MALCTTVAAPAAADGDTTTTTTKPTIVLVHGAFADASSWNGVVERLERRGYTVIAPANPLRGLDSDSAYIASVLDSIKGPIVLAGHSYGGAVISTAAAGNPRVKSLVYVSALMPDVGESGMSLAARFPSELGTATKSVPYRAGGVSGTDLYLKPDRLHQVFAADLPESTTRLMAVTQRPVATTAFSEQAKVAAWKHIPSWFLVAKQDKAINPDQERFEAKRAGSHTVEINSSHVAMIAHPEAVSDLVLQAATAAKSARPSLATTGSTHDARAETALTGIAATSLIAGAGAALLGRRLRRPAP
ncbi:alpha/beta fold hydrolase [Streptomyces avermitilis]|uniref:Alpha/beta hydrolase n=1 Tax=Streptomyces avermitilis TaxID=33903 RepID=A0A4D4MH70_STRAX|nr:alpha/beta hydrolase [Streptomyces avermitilis]GDY68591.1 alpha/beta hydrolase [Streptomyces avermitilis]GDY71035.1 alpha/beta hydrolase [Streptomyces avermitilis]